MAKAQHRPIGCIRCLSGDGLGFDFTMAFQPIVNVLTHQIFAHEALVRGLNREPADDLFRLVDDENRYCFDKACRIKAIQLAARLGIETRLSVNLMPNAIFDPEHCLRTTLEMAEVCGLSASRIIFEITEVEQIKDYVRLRQITEFFKERGFLTAIDDFGAGYAGLNLLAEIQADLIKLDMGLIRHIDQDHVRQSIIKGILLACSELSIRVIAEGVETSEELRVLKDLGIYLFQGNYFAKPAFESLAVL